MAEQNALNTKSDTLRFKPLSETNDILEQLNVPPTMARFIRRHRTILVRIFSGIIAAVVIFSLYGSYKDYRLRSAASALDAAMTATEKKQELLAEVADDFSRYPVASWAQVELARLAEEGGDTAKAITLLEDVREKSAHEAPLLPLVLNKLGALYTADKHFDTAIQRYEKLAEFPAFEGIAAKSLAAVYSATGDTAQAKAMYIEYLQKTAEIQGSGQQQDTERQVIEAHLTRLAEPDKSAKK